MLFSLHFTVEYEDFTNKANSKTNDTLTSLSKGRVVLALYSKLNTNPNEQKFDLEGHAQAPFFRQISIELSKP